MLLEYYLSSTKTESISDTKSVSNNLANPSSNLASKNAEQFKNVLNTSLDNRGKYHIKQYDTPYSESELLYAVQQWDKLYSKNNENIELNQQVNSEQFLEVDKTINLAINAKNQQFDKQYLVGDMVPTDGKKLPETAANSAITAAIVTGATTEKSIKDSVVQSTSRDKPITIPLSPTSKEGLVVTPSHKLIDETKAGVNLATKDKRVITEQSSNQRLNVAKTNELNQGQIITATKTDVKPTTQLTELPSLTNNTIRTSTKTDKLAEALVPFKDNAIRSTPSQIKNKGKTTESTGLLPQTSNLSTLVEKSQGSNDKASNIIAANEQNKASLAADKSILKSFNVPAEVLKNNQSAERQKTEFLKAELEKQSPNLTNGLQLKSNTEALLLTARREDALAAVILPSQNSSPTLVAQPLNVATAESLAIHTPTQLTTQLTTKASDVALAVSVSTKKWNQKFAQHVSMLALRGTSNAHIRLDPPELGPMAIRINHTGSETQIQFMVTNPIAKELVDSGMNRLREMLEQHGFENVNVDVNEFSKERQQLSDNELFNKETDEKLEEMNNENQVISEKVKSNSLIDLFV